MHSGGARCVQATGAVIHEVGRVGGDVRHRSEIDVDAQGREQGVLFLRVRHQGLRAAGGEELLGGAVFFTAQVGIGADAHHGAALLVHAQKQRDARVRLGGVLVGSEGLDDGVGGLVRKVPAKEHIAAQMVGGDVLHGGFRRTADEEQLPHLFLRGEGGEQIVDLLGRQLLRRGLRGRGGSLFLNGGALFRFCCAASGQGGKAKGGQGRRKKSFHRGLLFCLFGLYEQCIIFFPGKKESSTPHFLLSCQKKTGRGRSKRKAPGPIGLLADGGRGPEKQWGAKPNIEALGASGRGVGPKRCPRRREGG